MKKTERLILFKSDLKKTYFAPEWTFYIFENFIDNINFVELKNLILKKEKEIINSTTPFNDKGICTDGYTGLGPNSLTSRFPKFNLLKFQDNNIELLKKNILENHNKFLNKVNFPMPENLYIQCWANVLRKGEQIKPHIHGVKPYTYLGGHICVQCENTNTNYINPMNQTNEPEIYSSKNEVGKITLFQNFLPHFTDTHTSDNERITIAFDLEIFKDNITENHLQLI
jgi:hypothetical protein